MRGLFTVGFTCMTALTFAREASAILYEIGPSDDLDASIGMLVAGDELVLGGGTYSLNGYFEISVSGTSGQPILIRAKDGEVPIVEQLAAQNIVNITGSYVTLRGIELTKGDRGIRIQGASYVTIEDCHVHDTAANAISANDGGADYAGIVLRRNHIHHTGGNGEGMYLGCNNDGCQFHDGLIEGNWIHDTRGPTVDQGDGIEIKEGSYGNLVRDNVIHDTAYPCIITYSTVGNGAPNVIERNLLWGCGDHGIQAAADVVIRNNIILSAAASGISNQPHQAGDPANIEITHNTILEATNEAIRSSGIVGSVLIANNALYAETGDAIRVAGNLAGVTVTGNVGMGSLNGVSGGFAATGTLADFVGANFGGAPPNDVFPAPGSMLVSAADAAHLAMDDFNGTPRAGQADVGAYKFDGAGNPGWALGSGFKDGPAGSGGGAGAGGSGGSTGGASGTGAAGDSGAGGGSGGGAGSGTGGTSAGASGATTGGAAGSSGSAAGTNGASDSGSDGGCGCVMPAARARSLTLPLLALALGLPQRRRRRA